MPALRVRLGGGVCEIRIDHGPGYRVYYGKDGKFAILLLCGGDKRDQGRNAALALLGMARLRDSL